MKKNILTAVVLLIMSTTAFSQTKENELFKLSEKASTPLHFISKDPILNASVSGKWISVSKITPNNYLLTPDSAAFTSNKSYIVTFSTAKGIAAVKVYLAEKLDSSSSIIVNISKIIQPLSDASSKPTNKKKIGKTLSSNQQLKDDDQQQGNATQTYREMVGSKKQ